MSTMNVQDASATSLTENQNMSLQAAIDLMKFYEESASKKKERVWTLTTWVLTLNVGIIGFCFTFYMQQYANRAFILFEVAACLVGIVLCRFLQMLIRDQGQHISSAWTRANKVKAGNVPLNELLDEGELEKIRQPKYKAPFPRFCTRLIQLAWLFIIGFIGIMAMMVVLRYT
jgi:hypothetical protein